MRFEKSIKDWLEMLPSLHKLGNTAGLPGRTAYRISRLIKALRPDLMHYEEIRDRKSTRLNSSH